MDLQHICENVKELSINTGQFIRDERKKFSNNLISSKGTNDFVTHVDKAAEEKLVSALSKILPGSGFIAEEGTAQANNEKYQWIIDPIDGTTNFIHGAPPHSISIALRENEKLVMGVIYEIAMNECFYAFGDSPAYLNGEEIKCAATVNVKDSLIATGFPYNDMGLLNKFMETLVYFFHNSHGVRRLGSAAADLAYVACGRYDAFYEYNLNAWDVAAGSFPIQQAGGKVSDFSGGDNYLFGKEIIASTSAMFDEFQSVIHKIMKL